MNISLEFEHTVNIKLFGENHQQWEGHGFLPEINGVPQSHLDYIKMIAETIEFKEVVEEND